MSGAFRAALAWWAGVVTRRPAVFVLAAGVIAVAALGYALGHLGVNTSTLEMISSDIPFRQHATAYRRAFPVLEEPIVAVIDADTPEQAERAARALTGALRADEAHFTTVDYMSGEPFFVQHGLLYLNVDQLAELTDRLAAAQPLIAALAEDPSLRGLAGFVDLALSEGPDDGAVAAELEELFAAMADVVLAQLAGEPGRLSWRSLMTAEAEAPSTRRLVIATPRLERDTLAPAGAAIRAVRAEAEALGFGSADGVQMRLTGEAVLDAQELESVSAGAILAASLTTVAVATLLVWGLRSFRLIAATLITLAVGLVCTAAFAALAIGRLNLISVTFAVLFVGLGVDFGIHLTLRYREAWHRGRATVPAVRAAVAGVGGALSVSAICAALSFLSFVPTDYLGLAELGIISAAGMAIAWFASLTLLPALLCLMPLRRPVPIPDDMPLPATRLTRVNRPLLVVAGLAAIGAAALLPRVEFDPNPLNLKDPAAESVATLFELAEDETTSPYGIDVLAADLAAGRVLAERLRALEPVGRVVTLASFVPENQDEKLDLIEGLAFYLGPVLDVRPDLVTLDAEARRDALEHLRASLEAASGPAAKRLAEALGRFAAERGDSPEALAELERRLTGFLPDLLDQLGAALGAGPVTLADLPESLRARWLAADGRARVSVQPAEPIADNQDLRDFAGAVMPVVPNATGTPVVVTEAGRTVIQAFQEASVYAFVMITLVLALILRNWRDILLVLVPLVLAVLYTAASAVVLGLAFNFANVIVLPLLLGLGVSGAIHVVMRRRQSARNDLFATSTPRAVLFSALTTIASFGSLAVSDHRGLASMGLLLTIAIGWSLVCTLVILPSMLAALRPNPAAKTA